MRAPFVVQAEDQGRMDLSHDAADAELVSGGTELHELEREIAVLQPFRRPWWKMTLYMLLGIVTGGFSWLLGLWSTGFRAFMTLSKADSFQDADVVFVELHDKRNAICKIETTECPGVGKPVRYFVFHTVRFIYSHARRTFEPVPAIPPSFSAEMGAARQAVGAGSTPYSPSPLVRQRRGVLYGTNLLEVEAPNFWLIFGHDALQPFYCFQYASVIIWTYEEYYIYSGIVFVITMASILTNSISQYQERRRMAEMAYYVCEVELVRSAGSNGGGTAGVGGPPGPNGYPLVPSQALVPGDIVVIAPGKVAQDMVLLEGEAVVDETVLTGESVPVRKAAYDPELDGPTFSDGPSLAHCTLFNGTTVAAVRGGHGGRPALGIVASTAFNTAKGKLLRTIMFPRQHDLQFIKQALYFIVVMMLVAIGFYIWDVVAMVRFDAPVGTVIVKALDMITVAVPPALACCLAIATTISVMRLRAKGVFVLDNERVAMAGLLDAIAFDKTGTLTEIGLELGGVVPAQAASFGIFTPRPSAMPPDVQALFATCHGLTQLGDTVVGDPLDQRLFEASGFEMRFEEEAPAVLLPPGQAGAKPAMPGPYLVVKRGQPKEEALEGGLQQNGGLDGTDAWDEAPGGGSPARLGAVVGHHGPGDTFAASPGVAGMAGNVGGRTPLLAGQVRSDHPSGGAKAGSAGSHASASLRRSSLEFPLARVSGGPPGPQGAAGEHQLSSSPTNGTILVGPSILEKLTALGKGQLPLGEEAAAAVDHAHELVPVAAASHPSMIDPKHRAITLACSNFSGGDTFQVVRRFDFSSERLRSTAVVLHPDGRLMVYTKGSPEKLLTFMAPASLPTDYTDTLQDYTNQGLRVIGMACRQLTGLAHPSEVLAMSQEQLEEGCAFLGLVLMVNRLKPESAPTIGRLHAASIRTAMVTGDHVRTAVTVARQCGIMDATEPALIVDVTRGTLWEASFTFEVVEGTAPEEQAQAPAGPGAPIPLSPVAAAAAARKVKGLATLSSEHPASHRHGQGPRVLDVHAASRMMAAGEVQVAVTGRAWGKLNSEPDTHAELLDLVMQRGRVFARMSPEDKRCLIELLGFGEVDAAGRARPGCGYFTGYCGDGANDLGALKGALVGVSLCDAEASIAAPMTSRTPHIGIMTTVVAEGRCSMVTSLIIFKYSMVYAFVQVLSLALLYNLGLTVGNYQYLIQDMFHTTVLASCMGLTEPATRLGPERPLSKVLSMGVVLPVIAQLLVDTAFQLFALAALYAQPWFVAFDAFKNEAFDIPTSEKRPENSVLFIMSTWQLLINALVFNVGRPFRRGLWTNRWLLGALLVLAAFDLYVIWAPADPFKRKIPAVVDMPLGFRAALFGLVVANLVVAYLADWLSKLIYVAGKKYVDRKRGTTHTQRRLSAARKGLGPASLPRRDVELGVSGAARGLLPQGAQSSSSTYPAGATHGHGMANGGGMNGRA